MVLPAKHTYIVLWNLDDDDFELSSYENSISYLNQHQVMDYDDSLTIDMMPRATEIWASLNNWKAARRGDRFFIYLVSDRPGFKNRIVGSGFLYSMPYKDSRWRTPGNENAYTVELDFDVMLNPRLEYELLTEESLELQFPDYDWSGQTTDLLLDRMTAYLLEYKWYHYLLSLDLKCEGSRFWCPLRGGIADMYNGNVSCNYPGGRARYYMQELERLICKEKLNQL